MRNLILIMLIFICLFLSSCSDVSKSNQYSSLKKENEQLKSLNNDLLSKVNELENEKNILDNKIKEMEKVEDISEMESNDTVQATIIPINTSISVDGGDLQVSEGSFLLHYKEETFISFDLIKEIYGLEDMYGYQIKGFPVENIYHIRKNDTLELETYIKELEEEFKNQDNYNDISLEMNGLKLVYGEVGLRKYIITKSLYITQRGITIGSTRADVKQAYGQLGSDDDKVWYTFINNAEFSEGNKFTFVFEEDRVIEIHYGW